MNTPSINAPETIFSACRRILGTSTWGRVWAAGDEDLCQESFIDRLASRSVALGLPAYLPDLARLEWHLYQQTQEAAPVAQRVGTLTANPTMTLIPVGWTPLTPLLESDDVSTPPQSKPGHVMIWRHPRTGQRYCREATDIDLLALKIAVEQRDPRDVAATGRVSVGEIQTAVDQAVDQGLLVVPPSSIQRPAASSVTTRQETDRYSSADVFTLQWHITQQCDLHCRHCYDRSDRTPLPVDSALAVLNDLFEFCQQMHVRGQVTFTGGNPLLYSHFEVVYNAAAQLGLGTAILGNPGPLAPIQRLLDIAKPLFFQISLEGLPRYNDYIRGPGHFERSLAFLESLGELGIYRMVMLTLTRDNLDQVLPLADLLKGRCDSFTFNRLSAVGEGAKLLMPDTDVFASFLRDYLRAAAHNPVMGLKENLINIVREENGDPPIGGCAGHGCGAAFNFMALLPDGEVHACRKFPSPVGNVRQATLSEIYHSRRAARYRTGSHACHHCRLNRACRGCMAVVHSLGGNAFTDKDPFCWISSGRTNGRQPSPTT